MRLLLPLLLITSFSFGQACDTIRNYDPNNQLFIVNDINSNGYYPGNLFVSGFYAVEWAEKYTVTSSLTLQKALFVPHRIEDGNGEVYFRFHVDSAGYPGTVFHEDTIQLADCNELAWNEINFSSPITLSNDFWFGFTVSYANPTDTIALLTEFNGPVNHTYVNLGGVGWISASDLTTSNFAFGVDLIQNSTIDNNVTQNGATLTADQAGAIYQWLDCDNNYAVINGETNQSYTPAVTGNYAVEVDMNGCVDTSTCFLVDYTGIEELLQSEKELVKIIDFMGRETEFKPNTPLIFIYSDGTRERVMKIEE